MGLHAIYTQINDSVLAEIRRLPRNAAEDRIFNLSDISAERVYGVTLTEQQQ